MVTDEKHEMEYFIDKIDDLGLSRTSYIHAVQEFMARELPKEAYEDIYKSLTGTDRQFGSRKEARLHDAYLIQDIVKALTKSLHFDINQAVASAEDHVASLVGAHPYVLLEVSASEDPTSVPLASHTDPTSIPPSSHKRPTRIPQKDLIEHIWKKMKGSTKDEIIDAMIDAGVKKATANTYFYQLKKKYGFEGEVGKRGHRKQKSKKDIALELYATLNDGRPQSEIIDALAEALNTSKGGATTYFHVCKREAGFVGSTKKEKKVSKKELALKVYHKLVGKSTKQEIIAAIADACKTTTAGATTYYYACKKEG